MLVILLNCVTLGMFQPCEDVTCQTDWCLILQVGGCVCMCLCVSVTFWHDVMKIGLLLRVLTFSYSDLAGP